MLFALKSPLAFSVHYSFFYLLADSVLHILSRCQDKIILSLFSSRKQVDFGHVPKSFTNAFVDVWKQTLEIR